MLSSSICGILAIHSTQHEDINMLCPYSPHPSVVQRISNVMETPENSMALNVSGIKEDSGVAQGILVHAVAIGGENLYCRYNGCLHLPLV